MTPSVAVIVLNWNNASDTLACLESLDGVKYPSFHIIVVDNGSTDDSRERIAAAFPHVAILATGANLGYAEGNNVGVRLALGSPVDYICVLNNDVVVAPDFLTALVDEAESAADIGMVGPKMYFAAPSNVIFAAGSIIKWSVGELDQRGMGVAEQPDALLYNAEEDVDFIIGCGVLVRRQIIEAVGLLDPAYYLNFEDVDWCIRMRQAGYRVRYTPKAILWHKVSATLGRASPANTYYMTRNALLFFHRHAPGLWRWITPLAIMARTLRTVAAWTLKPRYRNDYHRRKRAANLYALRDFVFRRWGRMGEDVARVCYSSQE
jgi:hypothetical protein